MFPLQRESFPQDSETLRAALEESLRAVVRPAGPMVQVEDAGYPKLAALRISLDGAQTGDRPPPRPRPVGPVSPGLEVQDFEISANPLLVQRARVQLACTARDLRLGQGRDREGNVLLLLQDAADGNIEVAVALADLEALVLAGAKAEAAKQGVTVEECPDRAAGPFGARARRDRARPGEETLPHGRGPHQRQRGDRRAIDARISPGSSAPATERSARWPADSSRRNWSASTAANFRSWRFRSAT